jgi:hypothetical protein
MNVSFDNPLPSESGEDTLRLIATLPAPEGLEDRVHETLRTAPRGARVLAWPAGLRSESGWMRTAAAAAIVFVVVGGGWGVYSRVQHGQPSRVIVMPARLPGAGGFSPAGSIHTPQTLQGPTVDQPIVPNPPQAKTAKKPETPGPKPAAQPDPGK